MTPVQLAACVGCGSLSRAAVWVGYIEHAMQAYGIESSLEQAAFLANIGHESMGLQYPTEIWGPTPAQERYEGRADLGNTQPGDGKLYRGHGLIQVTGRSNHARVRDRLRAKFPGRSIPDFEADPGALAAPEWAALSAADFWVDHRIGERANAGDFDGVCDLINRGHKTLKEGDANGYSDRLERYHIARRVLG